MELCPEGSCFWKGFWNSLLGGLCQRLFVPGGLFSGGDFGAVLWRVFPGAGGGRSRGRVPGPGRGEAALGTGPGRLRGAGAYGTFHGTFGGTEPGERATGGTAGSGTGRERGWMEPPVRGHGNGAGWNSPGSAPGQDGDPRERGMSWAGPGWTLMDAPGAVRTLWALTLRDGGAGWVPRRSFEEGAPTGSEPPMLPTPSSWLSPT